MLLLYAVLFCLIYTLKYKNINVESVEGKNPTEKSPGMENSGRGKFRRRKVRRGKFRWGKVRAEKSPAGKSPAGKIPFAFVNTVIHWSPLTILSPLHTFQTTWKMLYSKARKQRNSDWVNKVWRCLEKRAMSVSGVIAVHQCSRCLKGVERALCGILLKFRGSDWNFGIFFIIGPISLIFSHNM